MHVLILHNAIQASATVEDRDVLVQRDTVRSALQHLGHRAISLPCTLDLSTTQDQLQRERPDIVFNLVESLGGSDRMMPMATMLLEAMELPFTGCGTAAILNTAGKLTSKQHMQAAGLPTPVWISTPRPVLPPQNEIEHWIVKPVWEHASFGMDDDSVLQSRQLGPILDLIARKEQETRRHHFAEAFIAGREFNLSLLQDADGAPKVLPPAEIDFSTFPSGKPRIVGHRAKWDEASFEYQGTPRTFDIPTHDQPLLNRLTELALNCWNYFGLRGYARIDFRVDRRGQPWILEVNVNPCLSPDAGFAAAVTRGGFDFPDAIRLILEAALRVSWSPLRIRVKTR